MLARALLADSQFPEMIDDGASGQSWLAVVSLFLQDLVNRVASRLRSSCIRFEEEAIGFRGPPEGGGLLSTGSPLHCQTAFAIAIAGF